MTKKFFAAQLLALCLALVFMALLGTGVMAGIVLSGLVLAVSFIEYVATPGKKAFRVQRILPRNFEQNQPAQVEVLLHGPAKRPLDIRVSDTPPATFRREGEAGGYRMEGAPVSHIYRVTPLKRGVFPFGRCFVEVRGRWGFCLRRFSLDCPGDAMVYPNLAPMRHYRMLAQRRQLSREDAALHKIRGIGADFAGLREYAPGDDRRKINWKASARSGKLITNIYDVEKNREVILAADTGRWMQAAADGTTRLDRALELAAAVMQVALSSGDKAGLVLFDTQVSGYLAPGKGNAHTRAFLQALYGARAGAGPSSFSALSAALGHKLTKRAFICLFTYLDSPEEAAQAMRELAPLKRRHSLYVASLTDVGLDELIQTEAAAPEALYLKAAAAYRKTAGLAAMDVLRWNGVGAYAAEPGELLTRSVRHYFTVRRMRPE